MGEKKYVPLSYIAVYAIGVIVLALSNLVFEYKIIGILILFLLFVLVTNMKKFK